MVYHIFEYRIGGVWYRDSSVYSDQQFSRIMDRLAWNLPYNVNGKRQISLHRESPCQHFAWQGLKN